MKILFNFDSYTFENETAIQLIQSENQIVTNKNLP